MTIKKLLTASIAVLSLSTGTAQSALVDSGDFSADTVSGLDWLKLSKVSGISYAQVASGALGYTTSGWRFATKNELLDLFELNIGLRNGLYVGNSSSPNARASEYFAATEDLVLKLGMNLGFSDNRATYNITSIPELHQIAVQGFYSDVGGIGLAEATAVYTGDYFGQEGSFGRWLVWGSQYSGNLQGANISSFLVRDSVVASNVPEPTTVALLGLGLLGFAASRRKSAKSNNS